MDNLPLITDIPPDYLSVLEQQYQESISGAATDGDILSITNELLEKTRGGMIWDESGAEQYVSVDEQAYWDSHQIETEAGLTGDDAPPNKALQIAFPVVLLLILAFGGWYFWGGGNDEAVESEILDPDAIADGDAVEAADPPPMAIGDELGAQVKIGQPASLEIRPYVGVEGTAFTVVNAPIEDRQIPILDIMRGDELVAEWLLGTVVNQVYGIPPKWLNQVEVGNQVLVRTDTGAINHFICTEISLITSNQNELFAQNRPGLTLFPLPAYESPVTVIWCPYDPEYERDAIAGGLAVSMGEMVEAGTVDVVADNWYVSEGLDGNLHLEVYGRLKTNEGDYGSIALSLNTPAGKYSPIGDQYQALSQEAAWLAQFTLPTSAKESTLQLEARNPLGGAALIDLGEIPDLNDFIEVDVAEVSWNEQDRTATVNVLLTNTHPNSSIVIGEHIFQANQGGDAIGIRVTEPTLPNLLTAGERTSFVIELTPSTSGDVGLTILNTQWEIQDIFID